MSLAQIEKIDNVAIVQKSVFYGKLERKWHVAKETEFNSVSDVVIHSAILSSDLEWKSRVYEIINFVTAQIHDNGSSKDYVLS